MNTGEGSGEAGQSHLGPDVKKNTESKKVISSSMELIVVILISLTHRKVGCGGLSRRQKTNYQRMGSYYPVLLSVV